ncbi:hypothetical protein [Streptomyces sp. NBC_00316]|uniref:hypothetical protein n=1 Tax=Streptomyces sp. NBC_00316 TaxID=2975710 RepID=UPI002E2BAA05|nr:hypothetical protein [Streptomyces sp. NBC_00316]
MSASSPPSGTSSARRRAEAVLAVERDQRALEPTDRVFFVHQGYQFEFMRGTGPDPEVWSYSEGEHADVPVRSWASFPDWLRATTEAEIPAWKHHVETVREEINADGSITLRW